MSSALETVCANVLQRELNVEDNEKSFLALGGDSLLAIKVLAQCRKQGITINIADIMAAPSMQSLYALVQGPSAADTSESTNDDSTLSDSDTPPPSTEADSLSILDDDLSHDAKSKLSKLSMSGDNFVQAVFPCSAIQERMVVSQVQNPHLYSCCFVLKFTHSHSGLPVYARKIGDAWSEVVKRHSILRTVLVESIQHPGHYNQVILNEITPVLEYHDGPEYIKSTSFDVRRPIIFEPYSIPHRLQLVQVSRSEVWMKLEISHLLVDGQSAEVLLRDLSDAYNGNKLSTAPLSYGQYVSSYLQRPFISSLGSAQEDPSHEITPLMFPMDRPNEDMSRFSTSVLSIPLDSRLVQSTCARYSATMATVCQLAWGLVLRCYGGTDKICFSYVNSGRSMSIPNIHDVIGPIVQTSLCSIQMSAADTLSTILQQLHKSSLQALSGVSPLESTEHPSKSARQLSNTTMSFQRALDEISVRRAELSVTIKGKANPTDVSTFIPLSLVPLLLIAFCVLFIY